MATSAIDTPSRRRFMKLLGASPLLPYANIPPRWMQRLLTGGGSGGDRRGLDTLPPDEEIISAAKDALNVMDFEPAARQSLPPAHFGYLATGVDDDGTIRANREGFGRFQIRVRRLIDISRIDMSVELFGARWSSPIILCPVGSQKAFHPEGEVATARAAKAKRHLQILSTQTTSSVEEVNTARGEPVWYQLYARDDWNDTRMMVKRAEAAGCPALVWTIDLLGGSNRETLRRAERRDPRQCAVCHDRSSVRAANQRRPMYEGLALAPVPEGARTAFTWDYVKRLKDATRMKLLLKGIVTREDAELAVEHGVDGLIVSNHGGRGEESVRSTIESLPEVVAGAAGRAPVIVDSGFRRGTDIFKALAVGATAVGVGRPYIWGLASFGQEGVETVLELLRRELQMVMRQAGTPSIDKITRGHVVDRQA